jgi:hypothetical protein
MNIVGPITQHDDPDTLGGVIVKNGKDEVLGRFPDMQMAEVFLRGLCPDMFAQGELTDEQYEKVIEYAKHTYGDWEASGNYDFDHRPVVSASDYGCYVQMWVWVNYGYADIPDKLEEAVNA